LVLVLRWFWPFSGEKGGLFFLWGVDCFAEEVTTLWTLLSSDRRPITSLLLDAIVILETGTFCVCCLSLPRNITCKITRDRNRSLLSSLAKFINKEFASYRLTKITPYHCSLSSLAKILSKIFDLCVTTKGNSLFFLLREQKQGIAVFLLKKLLHAGSWALLPLIKVIGSCFAMVLAIQWQERWSLLSLGCRLFCRRGDDTMDTLVL
jgi:hypothetical protein